MFVTLFRRSTIVINTNSKKQIIRGLLIVQEIYKTRTGHLFLFVILILSVSCLSDHGGCHQTGVRKPCNFQADETGEGLQGILHV